MAEHALVRTALRSLLESTSGLTVVGAASDVEETLRLAHLHQPNVILFGDGAAAHTDETFESISRAAPQACVLMLSSDDSTGQLSQRNRNVGCLPKNVDIREFCSTVAALLGASCAGCVLRPHCPTPGMAVPLSRRETQVAIRVAAGLTSKQIAEELGVRIRTVHTYRESLARKLGASSAAVVTRYVIEMGLTDSVPVS
jgi:DNA-binding NarL/FixJ family response regulator